MVFEKKTSFDNLEVWLNGRGSHDSKIFFEGNKNDLSENREVSKEEGFK